MARDEIQALKDEIAALRASVTGGGTATVTEHAGGVGTTVHETWSQYDQELARRGEHPAQQETPAAEGDDQENDTGE